ncbi:hypothetical protein O181_054043 [Austropuccinia psidii MF-1]|uniref:Uncharacterized protein n=1 Tax=Austropuccinia psidii MF-1 TaxID=1389203 RepID=A0A9Q3HR06_9BASI|nr:hypothetical protein [Austropuccinia psidii MF-1]
MNSHLDIKSFLGQEKTIELLGELVEEPKSFIHRPEERVGNDPSFGERRPSGFNQLQTSSRSVQGQAQKTSEETERSQEQSRQGKRQIQLAHTLPTRVQDPQIGAFSKSVLNMARTLMEFTAKEQERLNRNFPHK